LKQGLGKLKMLAWDREVVREGEGEREAGERVVSDA
jgi:hypothetical protein